MKLRPEIDPSDVLHPAVHTTRRIRELPETNLPMPPTPISRCILTAVAICSNRLVNNAPKGRVDYIPWVFPNVFPRPDPLNLPFIQ